MKAFWAGMVLVATLAALAIEAHAQEPAPPPQNQVAAPVVRPLITVSKETTFVTEPLRADGTVDFAAAINARYSAGVTPENNAAVLLFQAVGPREIQRERRAEFFKQLGMPELPENGAYFIPINEFAKKWNAQHPPVANPNPADEEPDPDDVLDKAMAKPWSRNEYPLIAAWLEANQKPLQLAVEASRRPRYFQPLIVASDEALLMAGLMPALDGTRGTVKALIARAMLRAKGNAINDAWQDLLAGRRLARLISQGPGIIFSMVGIATEATCLRGEQALYHHGETSKDALLQMRADIERLGPLTPVTDPIGFIERLGSIDTVTYLGGNAERPIRNSDQPIIQALLLPFADWDEACRVVNHWFDRYEPLLREPDRIKRRASLTQFRTEVAKDAERLRETTRTVHGIISFMFSKTARGKYFGGMVVHMTFPAIDMIAGGEDLIVAGQELNRIALALAIYRAERGGYPATLAELAPDFIPELPKDVFADADLFYKLQDDGGYVLYSVGPNGKDDGGRDRESPRAEGDEGDWDDLVIRAPGKSK